MKKHYRVVVISLRDYIYNWKYNPEEERYYLGNRKSEVKNQELLIECFYLLNELRKTNIVNIFHQCGHVDNGFDNIKNAAEVHRASDGERTGGGLIYLISLYKERV